LAEKVKLRSSHINLSEGSSVFCLKTRQRKVDGEVFIEGHNTTWMKVLDGGK
jgi:hypothetical protein